MAFTFDPKANLVKGSVAVAPSPADTGTTFEMVNSEASNFPDPATDGEYNILWKPQSTAPTLSNAEIVRVTNKSVGSTNTTFTVIREQEGTTARSVVVGDDVLLVATAKSFEDIENALNSALTSSIVKHEDMSSQIDGSNTSFTTAASFQTGSLMLVMNNSVLEKDVDYTEKSDGSGFDMTTAPATTDTLYAFYNTNTTNFATGSASWVYNETPSGTVDGSNTTFTLAHTPVSGSLMLFRDGQLMKEGDDYTLSGNTITFSTAPASGSVLLATYQSSLSVAGNADLLDGKHASEFTQNDETDVSGKSWVLDEDDMASNDATKVPTQQSVKAYSDLYNPNLAGAGEKWQYSYVGNVGGSSDITLLTLNLSIYHSYSLEINFVARQLNGARGEHKKVMIFAQAYNNVVDVKEIYSFTDSSLSGGSISASISSNVLTVKYSNSDTDSNGKNVAITYHWVKSDNT